MNLVSKGRGIFALVVGSWVASVTALAAQGRPLQLGLPVEVGRSAAFSRIAHVSIGPNGLLAVSQPEDRQVLLFNLTRPDSPRAVVGRKGEGPGEFAEPGRLGWIGTTLWVIDRGRPRVEYFDSSGARKASQTLDVPQSSSRFFSYTTAAAVLQDSAIVYYPTLRSSAASTEEAKREPPYPILIKRGMKIDTLQRLLLAGNEVPLRGDLTGGRPSGYASQPFSDLTFLRQGAGGARVLLVAPEAPNTASPILVRTFSSMGRQELKKRLTLPLRKISDAGWDSVLVSSAMFYGSGVWSSTARAKEALAKTFTRPKFYPAVTASLFGPDGSIWLRLDSPEKGVNRWLVLQPDGSEFGKVAVPSGVRLLDASKERVVGVRVDADGVEHLVTMALLAGR